MDLKSAKSRLSAAPELCISVFYGTCFFNIDTLFDQHQVKEVNGQIYYETLYNA